MKAEDYAMLIVDLTTFLQKYTPGKTTVTPRERLIIKRGIVFLQMVLKGQEILTSQNALAPCIRDLDAYSFANRALCDSPQFPYPQHAEEKRHLFSNALLLLQQIEMNERQIRLSNQEVEQVRLLFDHLAKLAFTEVGRETVDFSVGVFPAELL